MLKKRSKSVFQEMQNNSFLSDDELAFLEFLPLKALWAVCTLTTLKSPTTK